MTSLKINPIYNNKGIFLLEKKRSVDYHLTTGQKFKYLKNKIRILRNLKTVIQE